MFENKDDAIVVTLLGEVTPPVSALGEVTVTSELSVGEKGKAAIHMISMGKGGSVRFEVGNAWLCLFIMVTREG